MYKEIKGVTPYAAYEKIKNGALLLDVREAEEIEMMSYDVQEQLLIPQDELASRLDEIPMDRAVIVACHSGNRSGEVVLFLLENKFKNVYNLSGGISQWLELELPVIWDSQDEGNVQQVHEI